MNKNENLAHHLDELLRALCIIKVVGQVDGHDVIRRASVVDVASRRLDWARGLGAGTVPAAPAPRITDADAEQAARCIVAQAQALHFLRCLPEVPEAARAVVNGIMDMADIMRPAGQLVPTEPTEAMILAGDAADQGLTDVGDIYRAMLAAAPGAPAV